MFEKSNWIWANCLEKKDSYVSFKKSFMANGKTLLRLCAETDYIVKVNGNFVSFGQFAGFRTEKYFDEIDITRFCKSGDNQLLITVRYEGLDTATHIDDGAGLIYEIESDKNIVAYSDATTQSCVTNEYTQELKKIITIQLGYSSEMNSSFSDEYSDSKVIERNCSLTLRPLKKPISKGYVGGKEINVNGVKLYDLGREYVGFLRINAKAKSSCKLIVSYGEHIADGKVRRIINNLVTGQNRDFSVSFNLSEGKNDFTQYFVRLACRYLQVEATDGVEIEDIGLITYGYEVQEKPINLSGLDAQIYEACLNTLKLCMYNHYEDCPWREQALYSLDSRNQMLCGYYAFKDTKFQRENLVFMSKGKRLDGLLELTCPAVNTPAIPFFSIIYLLAVSEYLSHTGDFSIMAEIEQTVKGITLFFASKIEQNGLIKNLPYPYWNFYEWTEGSDGDGEFYKGDGERVEKYDFILNASFVYCVEKLKSEYKADFLFDIDTSAIKKALVENFYVKEKNIFKLSTVTRKSSKLATAFACLIGIGNKELVNKLKEDSELTEETLSMAGFVYDALLDDDINNAEYVLKNIRKRYEYMLSKGTNTVWETLKGYVAPNSNTAGSLCHGWSAMPVYYYNKFLSGFGDENGRT